MSAVTVSCNSREKQQFISAANSFYLSTVCTTRSDELRLQAAIILSSLCAYGSAVCLTLSHLTSLFSTRLLNSPRTAAGLGEFLPCYIQGCLMPNNWRLCNIWLLGPRVFSFSFFFLKSCSVNFTSLKSLAE